MELGLTYERHLIEFTFQIYEKNLPPFQNQKKEKTRLSQQNGDAGRAPGCLEAPEKREKAAYGLMSRPL